jgi:hypothetical protein
MWDYKKVVNNKKIIKRHYPGGKKIPLVSMDKIFLSVMVMTKFF